jgi:hypothetical protein
MNIQQFINEYICFCKAEYFYLIGAMILVIIIIIGLETFNFWY